MSESKGVKFLRFLAEHGLAVTIGLGASGRVFLFVFWG